MTREDIRMDVRDILGEDGFGTWTDDELNRYIYRSACRHAQEALSVIHESLSSSIYGVQEYDLPIDYGEMRSVRFISGLERTYPLFYTRKDVLLQEGHPLNQQGLPERYYIFNDKMGLWPVPSKPPILTYEPEDITRHFKPVYDREERENYSVHQQFDLIGDEELENDDTETEEENLYPQVVYISHMELYVRRMGPQLPGLIWLSLTAPDCPAVESKAIRIRNIRSQAAPIRFDFSNDPIEVYGSEDMFTLEIHTNSEYNNAVVAMACRGIEVGVDEDSDEASPWFQLHQLKNDIQIDYYKNTVNQPEDDDDILEIPDRHRNCLTELTLELAYEKNNMNLAASNRHGNKAVRMMKIHRAQEKQKTLGDRVFTNKRPAGRAYHGVQGGIFRGNIFGG